MTEQDVMLLDQRETLPGARDQRTPARLPDDIFRCVHCHDSVERNGGTSFECQCGHSYPIVNNIPILLNETNSVFRTASYKNQAPRTGGKGTAGLHSVLNALPSLTLNLSAERLYAKFFDSLPKPAVVLIVGGGIAGKGLVPHLEAPDIQFVETDVYFGDRNQVICDGHDLPFADNSVDGVIIQAVLEHVLDPPQCVAEIHRVLKPNGVVYAEIPFMQQVHAGKYDFTRYTHLGFRRLFRMFDELDSGMSSGPGSAMAWAYQYLLLSFVRGSLMRGVMRGFARLTGFWLKYLDLLVKDSPGSLDAACGVYFMGTKAEKPLSDHDLLAGYRGASTS